MNIGRIFIDTEFTDFTNMDLISIGAVASNGAEFYGENSEFLRSWASSWVQSNIYPLLDFSRFGMKRKELSARLWSWIDELPYDKVIVSVDYNGDWNLLYDLFEEDSHPKIATWENLHVTIYREVDRQIIDAGDVNSYQTQVSRVITEFKEEFNRHFAETGEIQHHALSDARANRRAWSHVVINYGMPL